MIQTAEFDAKLKQYRISKPEYDMITQLLGREMKGVEWALFSALWSEHCSYKSSRVHLKKFGKTLTSSVLQSQGENAGVVDLGFGEKVIFKMESHNHPSFIEPYQGAATGVGGILRDIFTMGARPIASADFLCFGGPKAERMKVLVDGVVRGISGYGNSVGVPTVTGATHFDESYNKNILVNAMNVGLVLEGQPISLSGAKGPGNDVVYVGAKTGKDGVHGASMASESFGANNEAKKPNVQIGDPFYEKLLIESCLEVIGQDLVVSIQDMGAAGLTSSSFEMSAKGGLGFDLELDKVPVRDSTIGPEEILLSESQERMLLICEPAKFAAIEKIFANWGLDAVRVGKVRADKTMRLLWKGETLAEIDPGLVVDNSPEYKRPYDAWIPKRRAGDLPKIKPAAPGAGVTGGPDVSHMKSWIAETVNERLAGAEWASREDIYHQYDQRVGAKTARGADAQAALLRLPASGRGMFVATGCRPALMKVDAQIGAYDAVVEPSLKMAIKGGRPIGVTDCLNFGNPEKPEIMSEFVASVEGIRDISLALEIPVISGNVSFYNETEGRGITSTPACGIVGLRDSVENVPQDFFTQSGSSLIRVKFPFTQIENGRFLGGFDLSKAARMLNLCRTWADRFEILSSQTVGQGGWFWTALKMAGEKGFTLTSEAENRADVRASVFDFGLYELIFEVPAKDLKTVLHEMNEDLADGTEAMGFAEHLGETTDSAISAWGYKTSGSEFQASRHRAWRADFE